MGAGAEWPLHSAQWSGKARESAAAMAAERLCSQGTGASCSLALAHGADPAETRASRRPVVPSFPCPLALTLTAQASSFPMFSLWAVEAPQPQPRPALAMCDKCGDTTCNSRMPLEHMASSPLEGCPLGETSFSRNAQQAAEGPGKGSGLWKETGSQCEMTD